MNNSKLIRKLKDSYLVRCKQWVVCGSEECLHYAPHNADIHRCMLLSPVKFCRRLRGFVHDIPIHETDSNYQCNPNLAFKAKRDADDRKEKEYKKAMLGRRS
jgi:hypothetical protein